MPTLSVGRMYFQFKGCWVANNPKPGQTQISAGYDLVLHFLSMSQIIKTFCGFSMGRNQYWAGRVYDLCVYHMTGTPKGSTESGFMEKPGIEPATPC